MLLVVDNGSKHTVELEKYLRKRKIKFILARSSSRLRTVLKHRYMGVIFTGGPMLYDSKINIERVDIDIALLLDLDVPVLGICFGHQTIVEAFDGRIKRERKRIKGTRKIEILKKIRLFRGLPKYIEMYESHLDCASRLPYGFERIARSKSCSIEAIKHKKKHIYGLQFHPEASGKTGYRILDNFIGICKI